MGFFVLPQAWITPAIMAAAIHFGSIEADHVAVKYRNLPAFTLGQAAPPNRIILDKRPAHAWTKEMAQCVLIHEYGHLERLAQGEANWDRHSRNRQSIMHASLRYQPCIRWLRRHGVD